jgi:hypothetical protein
VKGKEQDDRRVKGKERDGRVGLELDNRIAED